MKLPTAYDKRPQLPEGIYVVCAAYGCDHFAHLTAFMAWDANNRQYLTGTWDSTTNQPKDLKIWDTAPEQVNGAAVDYARQAQILVASYPAAFPERRSGGFTV